MWRPSATCSPPGKLDVQRVVSLAGPCVHKPAPAAHAAGRAHDGAHTRRTGAGVVRVISGSVLDGRTAAGEVHGYLGRYHLQVSVRGRSPATRNVRLDHAGLGQVLHLGRGVGRLSSGKGLALNTTTNGGARAMVPIGSFRTCDAAGPDAHLPAARPADGQDERAEKLGCLELDEDDLALCTFVCPGKAEYGPLLRQALTRIEKEAA
jgi:Na+-transporting NADH:ubiquinone oxidoreductase subunit A